MFFLYIKTCSFKVFFKKKTIYQYHTPIVILVSHKFGKSCFLFLHTNGTFDHVWIFVILFLLFIIIAMHNKHVQFINLLLRNKLYIHVIIDICKMDDLKDDSFLMWLFGTTFPCANLQCRIEVNKKKSNFKFKIRSWQIIRTILFIFVYVTNQEIRDPHFRYPKNVVSLFLKPSPYFNSNVHQIISYHIIIEQYRFLASSNLHWLINYWLVYALELYVDSTTNE